MSVVKNYMYNTVYQIMTMLIPLITMPYLTRVFAPDQLGLNTYTLSIANYFMLFGMLGMQMYGNRQIAYVRDTKEKLRTTFWSLYITQFITCTIALIIYYLLIGFYIEDNRLIYLIQGLNVFSVLIDISWLFMGLENFKNVVIRNTIAKLIGLISIFVFVRSGEDLALYTFLIVFINIISTLVMWLYVPKYVGKFTIDINMVKKTIKPLLALFIPQIATQVYGILARTMVGVLSTNEQVAFYDYSQKIVRMVLALITSIGVVLMPRVANIVGRGKVDEVPKIIERTFKVVSYLSIPMAFGLMSISQILISWFLAPEYYEVGILTAVSSVIIIPVSWANIIGIQYLIAIKQEKKYTISIIIAAIFNLVFNLILIKPYGAFGAIISLVVAEFVGVIIQMILVRKQLPIGHMFMGIIKYFIAGILMAIVATGVGNMINIPILANILQGVTGVLVYGVTMIIIKDDVQKELLSKITLLLTKK